MFRPRMLFAIDESIELRNFKNERQSNRSPKCRLANTILQRRLVVATCGDRSFRASATCTFKRVILPYTQARKIQCPRREERKGEKE